MHWEEVGCAPLQQKQPKEINFLPQSLFFSPPSYQQTLSRMQNGRFPKISLETRNIKRLLLCCISPAISGLFQTDCAKETEDSIVWLLTFHNGWNLSIIDKIKYMINERSECKRSEWHLTLHNGRKLIKLPVRSNSSCSFIILANLEYNTHIIQMHYRDNEN